MLSSNWDGRPFGHSRHGPKIEGPCPFWGAWSPSNTVSPGPRPTSVPSGILIDPAIWPQQTWAEKWGLRPFGKGGAGSPSNTTSLWLRPTSIPSGMLIDPAIWPQQVWAHNWGLCPFRGRGAGSPSNTLWPGTRPTYVLSYILIRPTVWPQYTNGTDRTGQTDWLTGQYYGPIAYGEPCL